MQAVDTRRQKRMDRNLEDALIQKYPALFELIVQRREEAPYWPLRCDNGWFTLIDTLCAALTWDIEHGGGPQIRVRQIKEKFGTLRFYVTPASDYQKGLISMAAAMSERICELCGAPGMLRLGAQMQTLCASHFTQRPS